MDDSLVAVASALNVYERKLDAAALNIAHARTPGYVPRVVSGRSFASEFASASSGSNLEAVEALSFAPGEIVSSANPLAVALTQDGFFEVETPEGKAYTRGGDFEIVNGVVSTRGGYPVVGVGGQIAARAEGGAFAVSADGVIRQGGIEIGKLKVVRFADSSGLVAVADTMVRPEKGEDAATVAKPDLAPGMIELPGTQAVQSLVDMIVIQRSFESAQRASGVMHDAYERLLRSSN